MPNPTRCLFIDDHHLTEIKNLQRTLNPVDKHPANPILKPDQPWEGDNVWIRNNIFYDVREKLFRMWYNSNHAGGRTGYATSPDGLHWEKPTLSLVEFEGSTQNNIVDSHGRIWLVIRDEQVPSGPLPQNHIFLGSQFTHEKGQCAVTSPDGLHWTDGPTLQVLAGDALIYDRASACLTGPDPSLPGSPTLPNLPRYLGPVRWCVPVREFDGATEFRPTRRVQVLYKSNDFLNWFDPTRILTPDDRDDEMAQARIEAALADGSLVCDCKEDRRCEFYSLVIFPYEDMFIGTMMVFDPAYEFKRTGGVNQPGPIEMQLVASRDLVDWRRLGDRQPFIPRGAFGQFDWAHVAFNSLPMVKDHQLWFFYTGSCAMHGDRNTEPFRKATNNHYDKLLAQVAAGQIPAICSVGLATLRRDGFISLDAGDTPGHVLTKPFPWPRNNTLHLNTDARHGQVRVSLCQPDGTEYPGYELSDPITTDTPDTVITWTGQTYIAAAENLHTHATAEEAGAKPHPDFLSHQQLNPGKMVRLKITAQNAKLYSYWF